VTGLFTVALGIVTRTRGDAERLRSCRGPHGEGGLELAPSRQVSRQEEACGDSLLWPMVETFKVCAFSYRTAARADLIIKVEIARRGAAPAPRQ
jgi:hypothetical protein